MSNQLILVLNCGSSSLKGAVIDRKNGKVLLSCLGERLGTPRSSHYVQQRRQKMPNSFDRP